MSASISLQNVSVFGVDTLARASTIRQWFIKRQSLNSVKVPILQQVNFSATAGDRIALIGANGSGKSSLLKVISGNYPIHAGVREVNGSIIPLIEMGAGFEPEISGRMNIKLSSAYHGRLRHYTQELEDKIIDFSELGDKIDLQLKTYSSGMASRLAFSSAVFHDSEILLLDEVLATGDAGFANKSAHMLHTQISKANITIMVSHSTEQALALCNRFVLMHNGKVINDGNAKDVMRQYQLDILKLGETGAQTLL